MRDDGLCAVEVSYPADVLWWSGLGQLTIPQASTVESRKDVSTPCGSRTLHGTLIGPSLQEEMQRRQRSPMISQEKALEHAEKVYLALMRQGRQEAQARRDAEAWVKGNYGVEVKLSVLGRPRVNYGPQGGSRDYGCKLDLRGTWQTSRE